MFNYLKDLFISAMPRCYENPSNHDLSNRHFTENSFRQIHGSLNFRFVKINDLSNFRFVELLGLVSPAGLGQVRLAMYFDESFIRRNKFLVKMEIRQNEFLVKTEIR